MLKRKVYDSLFEWKTNRGDECLLIKGARQIGKTYVVEQFGKNEYESFIEINFLKQPALKAIFAGDLTSEDIYKRMSAFIPNIKLVEGNTLIFLDEIQKCANARTALKFLAQDRRFDVIASGSLLGLHYGQDADDDVEEISSIPVGYEGYTLHYYKKSDSTMEIEFLIEKNGEVLPVEVKAGNAPTASLNNFITENKPSLAYKLIDGNIGFVDSKYTLPHYMALFI